MTEGSPVCELCICDSKLCMIEPKWDENGSLLILELRHPHVGVGRAHAEIDSAIVKAHREPPAGDLLRHRRHKLLRSSGHAVQQVNLPIVQEQ